ncbi:hypothetical protein BKA64DRAFT_568081 [Cadophora sp. MPI-SDFR-AT-0126]|nr:hypothetical protein BKA64DRAFT_568081 [Leotiomycetes sp. MPI-SDFR-AT-0126]
MASSPPIKIAIIGAGIGGITLAIAISKHNPDLQLTLFESRAEFSEIGAGVGFGPNATQAMRHISPEVEAVHDKVKTPNLWPEKDHIWYDLRYGTGPRAGEMIGEIEAKGGFRHCGASRAHFLDGLVGLIPETVKVQFGKKVVDVVADDQDGKMRVLFDDGKVFIADAVVGCDGIRSACRRILLGPDDESAKAVYSGKYAYRKVIDMKDAVKAVGTEVENRTIYSGRGGHLLMFPIRAGKALNIVVFRDSDGAPWTQHQWVIPSSRKELLRDFEGWGEKPIRILELMESPDKWALFDHLPAPTYSKGNFCLLGDAAHATTPHSGAGAGFAIEDAHLLSALLSSENIKSAEHIQHAFKAYDEVRRPRSQELVTRSRRQGMMLDLQKPDGGMVSGEELRTSMEKNQDWVWEVDLSQMLREGNELFKRYSEA